MKPRLWILAGPNGSGKSTLVSTGVFKALTNTPESGEALVQINPDQAALRMQGDRPDLSGQELALAAAQSSDALLDDAIDKKLSVLVETVLSSDKLIARVDRANAAGYSIGLVFVLLQSPDINVARVAARVAQGGHDVPEDKIRARWKRSLTRLSLFAAKASAFWVLDNSARQGPAMLLIERSGDVCYVSPAAEALIASPNADPALSEALNKTISLV